MIPKVIHLCWFSGDAYPPLIEKCIRSWSEQMPEYKVHIWRYEDAARIPIPYLHEALNVRKWAFAADVVRVYALYTEGGVYLDSDFYVKRDLTPLFTDDFVSSIEIATDRKKTNTLDKEGNRLPQTEYIFEVSIQAAFMASVKGHPFMKQLLDYYKDQHFIKPNGRVDMSVLAPQHYARVAEQYGFKYCDCTQKLKGGITIYSSKYIAGHYLLDQPQAYGIHACEHSWGDRSLIRRIGKRVKRIWKDLKKRF